MPVKHKLGFGYGSIVEYEDGTAAYRASMTMTDAFRVPISEVTGFTVVKSAKVLERTLNVLGRGSIIASVSVNHGTSELVEEWFRSHPLFGTSGAATAADVHSAAQSRPTELDPSLIADELEKLSNLRDKGVLTDEEFQQRKTFLLNRS